MFSIWEAVCQCNLDIIDDFILMQLTFNWVENSHHIVGTIQRDGGMRWKFIGRPIAIKSVLSVQAHVIFSVYAALLKKTIHATLPHAAMKTLSNLHVLTNSKNCSEPRIIISVLKPNSWTYNFVWVSGIIMRVLVLEFPYSMYRRSIQYWKSRVNVHFLGGFTYDISRPQAGSCKCCRASEEGNWKDLQKL
jgi:hypothetical protein